MSHTNEQTIVTSKIQLLYSVLLELYPEQYRKDFAEEMLMTFTDLYQEELATHGKIRVHFWFTMLTDTFHGVLIQHKELLREQGIRSYLKTQFHFSLFNALGLLCLLPFFLLLVADMVSRIVQGDLTHYNRPLYTFISHTPLYSSTRMIFLWLLILPFVAVMLNSIPVLMSLIRYQKKKMTFTQVVVANPFALLIMGLGLSFLVLALGHDVVPCFLHSLFSRGIFHLGEIISVCQNA